MDTVSIENSMEKIVFFNILKKQKKIKLQYDPEIPLLDIYPEEITTQKDTCTPMLIAALFRISRTLKQPKCPSTDEWFN